MCISMDRIKDELCTPLRLAQDVVETQSSLPGFERVIAVCGVLETL